jgi:23S rRNA pseudouridine2457 synthase
MIIAFHKPFGVLSQFTSDGSPNRPLAEFGFPKDVYPIGRLDADSEGLLLLSDEARWNERLLHPRHAHEREYWAQVERIPEARALEQLQRGVRVQGRETLPCRAWVLEPQPVVVAGDAEGEKNIQHSTFNPSSVAVLRRVDIQHPRGGAEAPVKNVAPAKIFPRTPPIRFRKSVPDCWIGLELIEGKNRQVRRMTAAVGHSTLRLLRVRVGSFWLSDLPPGRWRILDEREMGMVAAEG